MKPETLYRVAFLLGDGRKVYVSKRGLLHLMSHRQAVLTADLNESNRARPDPGVYARDLSFYGNRSLFLDSGVPFVAVVRAEVEPADGPVDPGARVLGDVPASEVGAYEDRLP